MVRLQADEGTIRLFEREANQKRYYSFHGDDAIYIAENVYKTLSVVKYWGGKCQTLTKGNRFLKLQCVYVGEPGLATTTLSGLAAESFLRDALLTKQLRIEIWTNQRGQWQLTRKASPGNLQDVEDFLFTTSNMTASPVVMAVKLGTSGEHKVRTEQN